MEHYAKHRKQGKPNRGGGHHSRGRRGSRGHSHGGSNGGGGGMGRKGSNIDWDDLTDGPVLEGKRARSRGLSEDKRASNQGFQNVGSSLPVKLGHSNDFGSSNTRSSKDPKVKVQMQHLDMSVENQELVREMLKSLHGDDHSIPSDNEYDELDTRGEDHYWQVPQPLSIESLHSYSVHSHKSDHLPFEDLPDDVSPVALKKLKRCGFSHSICVEALQLCDGDIGAAMEYLLGELRNMTQTDRSGETLAVSQTETIPSEIIELRDDEKLALASIFEHRFIERIPNRVWILYLELPELKNLLNMKSESHSLMQNKPICLFYRKGLCRYGDKCKHLHIVEHDRSQLSNLSYSLQGALADNLFTLEVRFPIGNMYPKEVPLLAFSSAVDRLAPHSCLNISRFLMTYAQEFALMEQPAIFSLVNLLSDSEQLQILLDMPPISLPCEVDFISSVAEARALQRPLNHTDLAYEDDRQPSHSHDSSPKTNAVNEKGRRIHPTEIHSKQKEVDAEKEAKSASNVRTGSRSSHTDSRDSHKDAANILKQNKKLKEDFKKKQSSSAYQNRLSERQRLPAWTEQDSVLAALQGNHVIVISGMTGCGKTTQVPQFILDQHMQSRDLHLCNIICTQPRRISALAVAQRVADERCEKLGNSVGYQIRLESVQSSATRLLFCTTGIILRRLEGDPKLSDVTHLIVDEVHERSEESDFLLMILRDLLSSRPDLKVILMSATLNAELFSSYFNNCPIIEIPGKCFPVETFFLEDAIETTKYMVEENSPFACSGNRSGNSHNHKKHASQSYADAIEESLMGLSLGGYKDESDSKDNMRDDRLNVKQLAARYPDYGKRTIHTLALMDLEKINYDLIMALLEWIVLGGHEYPKSGAILVFLPGFAEIQTLLDMMLSSSEFGHHHRNKYKIVPLHSTLSSEEQNSVFLKPKEGVTKIVIATNIAETSITIDDIVYVIDAGRMKEKRYDSSTSMESLETVWVSKANALQRRGRAGRVTSGVCFHLFTSHRFEHHLREQPVPEIQRAPLEQLMLKIKMLGMFADRDAMEVLANVVEPPTAEAMENALDRLQDVGALDEHGLLTSLGYHLGSLPVDVKIGKLMLFGAIFRCLDATLTIAAALSFKSPFVSPFNKKSEADEKKKEFAVGNSDYLTILNAYKKWLAAKKAGRQEEYYFCQENFLSQKTLQMLANLKQQYVELLADIGFTRGDLKLRAIQRAAYESGGDGVLELTGPEANLNTDQWKLISAILVAALYPNVVQVMTPDTRYSQSIGGAVKKAPNPEDLRFMTKSDGYVFVHPSSVNFQVRHFESPYLVYHEKVKTSKVYIRDCTMVSIYSLMLFAGGHISIDLDRGNIILSVDEGWIRFRASSGRVAELLREVRLELDQLLKDKIKNPNMDLCTCPRGSSIINTIVTLISTQ